MTILDTRIPADERRSARLMLRLEQMSNAFYDGNPFDLFPDFDDQITAAIGGGGGSSFETVSKNLSSVGATLAYNGAGDLASITYASGAIKTLNYTGDKLTSIVLSGSIPPGIDTTKTLSYTGDDLTGITYS
jgi:hypothetical protein